MSSSTGKSAEEHCARCHETFILGDKSPCTVEHDFDLFEGSRNGTSWYTGTLGCCGADYRFHRHGSDSKAEPKYCFKGTHTADPAEVEYNTTTMKHCTAERCGQDLHASSKGEYEHQMGEKKRAGEAAKARRKEDRAAKRRRIGELKAEGRAREARRLRAEVLGMDPHGPDLDSDVDPDGCEEFDMASDSSLVPPWAMDGDY